MDVAFASQGNMNKSIQSRNGALRDASLRPAPARGSGAPNNSNSWHTMCNRVISMELELTQLRAENQKLRRIIFVDPLTGLQNRAALERDILPRWERGECGAVLVLDLDHFKTVNDTHGHTVGDRVLEDCGHLVKTLIRSQDEAVRYGGEEFVVLLADATIEEAARVADRIITGIAAHVFPGGLRMTASAGIAASMPPDWTALFAAADTALYAAKSGGRNRTVQADAAQVAAARAGIRGLKAETAADSALDLPMPRPRPAPPLSSLGVIRGTANHLVC